LLFLDRDGTINKDYPDKEWENVTEPELLNGSIEGMKKLIEKGF
jgi:D-glycero-D-manno-heptose 1,7-bisphosphate phosphatase